MVEKITKAFFSFEFEVFGRVQGFFNQNFSFSKTQKLGVFFRKYTQKEAKRLSFVQNAQSHIHLI